MPTDLEAALPAPHFAERHARRIAAPPDVVWAALEAVTMDDLRITRPLMALRHLGRRRPGRARPLLEDGPVQVLRRDRPRYAVAGAISQPWRRRPPRHPVDSLEAFVAFDDPGWVTYLTDFAARPCAGGTLLVTETRGRATSPAARRRFAVYWAVIRPGSGLVRRDVLRTVARIAERQTAPSRPQP